MKKFTILIIFLLALIPTSASAMSCSQVKQYIHEYGRAKVMAYARSHFGEQFIKQVRSVCNL